VGGGEHEWRKDSRQHCILSVVDEARMSSHLEGIFDLMVSPLLDLLVTKLAFHSYKNIINNK